MCRSSVLSAAGDRSRRTPSPWLPPACARWQRCSCWAGCAAARAGLELCCGREPAPRATRMWTPAATSAAAACATLTPTRRSGVSLGAARVRQVFPLHRSVFCRLHLQAPCLAPLGRQPQKGLPDVRRGHASCTALTTSKVNAEDVKQLVSGRPDSHTELVLHLPGDGRDEQKARKQGALQGTQA